MRIRRCKNPLTRESPPPPARGRRRTVESQSRCAAPPGRQPPRAAPRLGNLQTPPPPQLYTLFTIYISKPNEIPSSNLEFFNPGAKPPAPRRAKRVDSSLRGRCGFRARSPKVEITIRIPLARMEGALRGLGRVRRPKGRVANLSPPARARAPGGVGARCLAADPDAPGVRMGRRYGTDAITDLGMAYSIYGVRRGMARSAQISRAARVRKRFTGKNRRQRHAAARPLAAYGLSRLYAPRARRRAAVVLAPSCLDPASGAAPAEAVVTTHPLLL